MSPIRLAILASGSGSNAENIVRRFSKEENLEVAVILSNKSDALVHERARKLGIPSVYYPKEVLTDGASILRILQEREIDFIILAGYLLKIPAELIAQYPNRIVNIHPALLPKFGGKGMYGNRVHQAVIDANEKESGITIHVVDENYDEGSIVFQAKCPVLPKDTADDVATNVHALEYRHYPDIIREMVFKEFGR